MKVAVVTCVCGLGGEMVLVTIMAVQSTCDVGMCLAVAEILKSKGGRTAKPNDRPLLIVFI